MAYVSREALLREQHQRNKNAIHEAVHCLALLLAFGTGHIN